MTKPYLRSSLFTLPSLLFVLLMAANVSATPQPKPGTFYHLSNMFLKEGKQLAVVGGRLAMSDRPTADAPSHRWQFIAASDAPGHYRISNAELGDGKAIDSSPTAPHIADRGFYTGQLWRLVDAGNGYVRLSNMFQPNKSLDTFGNAPHDPFLGNTGNYSGQFWKLTEAPKTVAVKPGVQPAPTTGNNTTLEVKPGTLTVTPSTLQLRPGATTNSTAAPTNQNQIDVNSGQLRHATGSELSDLQPGLQKPDIVVSGCLKMVQNNATLPEACGPRGNKLPEGMVTQASIGATTFPEPGLGAFLVNGGLPILEYMLVHPDTTLSMLNHVNPFFGSGSYFFPAPLIGNGRNQHAQDREHQKRLIDGVCQSPLTSSETRKLLFTGLVAALWVPEKDRTVAQKALIATFAEYIWHRDRFAAEALWYVYQKQLIDNATKHSASVLSQVFAPPPQVPATAFDTFNQLNRIDASGSNQLIRFSAASMGLHSVVGQFPYANRSFYFELPRTTATSPYLQTVNKMRSNIQIGQAEQKYARAMQQYRQNGTARTYREYMKKARIKNTTWKPANARTTSIRITRPTPPTAQVGRVATQLGTRVGAEFAKRMLTNAVKEGIVGLIVTGAVVGSMEMIQQAVEWKQLEDAVADLLDDTIQPVTAEQLTNKAHSPEGLKELAGYWAWATSQPGAYQLKSAGNRQAACNQGNPNPSQIPGAVRAKIEPVSNVDSILSASGLNYVPAVDATDLGVAAWLVKAVAAANCYSPTNAERFFEQGQVSCANTQVGSVAWVPAAAAIAQADKIVVAGRRGKEGSKLQLCRASVGRDVGERAGWVSGDRCVIGWQGKEVRIPGHQVLVADPGAVKLVEAEKKTTVQAEVVAGQVTRLNNDGASNPEVTRVCTISMKDRFGMPEAAPGWIENDGECHAGWNGTELKSKDYLLLVAGESGMR